MIASIRKEVPVTKTSTILDVLESIGVRGWTGGKQIRIVKKNAILQSEFPKRIGAPQDTWEVFATTAVSPGDLVIICVYD
jgi:hypothetical protein